MYKCLMTPSCLIPGGTGGYRCGERRIYIKVLGQVGKMNDNSCQNNMISGFQVNPMISGFQVNPFYHHLTMRNTIDVVQNYITAPN